MPFPDYVTYRSIFARAREDLALKDISKGGAPRVKTPRGGNPRSPKPLSPRSTLEPLPYPVLGPIAETLETPQAKKYEAVSSEPSRTRSVPKSKNKRKVTSFNLDDFKKSQQPVKENQQDVQLGQTLTTTQRSRGVTRVTGVTGVTGVTLPPSKGRDDGPALEPRVVPTGMVTSGKKYKGKEYGTRDTRDDDDEGTRAGGRSPKPITSEFPVMISAYIENYAPWKAYKSGTRPPHPSPVTQDDQKEPLEEETKWTTSCLRSQVAAPDPSAALPLLSPIRSMVHVYTPTPQDLKVRSVWNQQQQGQLPQDASTRTYPPRSPVLNCRIPGISTHESVRVLCDIARQKNEPRVVVKAENEGVLGVPQIPTPSFPRGGGFPNDIYQIGGGPDVQRPYWMVRNDQVLKISSKHEHDEGYDDEVLIGTSDRSIPVHNGVGDDEESEEGDVFACGLAQPHHMSQHDYDYTMEMQYLRDPSNWKN